ncbi:MAG: glycosyltransferase [Desulfurococcaceae archaeon]
MKISDYLAKFYTSTYVLGYFSSEFNILRKTIPVRIYVKPARVPLIQGFIISILSFIKLSRVKPNTVLWTWGCFFPGGLLLKLASRRTKVFIDIRSHPISQRSKFITAMYNALFAWTLKLARKFVDGFTVISPSMWIYITKRYGIKSPKRLCVWTSGYDKELFEYVQRIEYKYVACLRKIIGVEEKHKVITYYGTISYSRLPLFNLLIEAFSLLRKDHDNVKLLIVGKGDAVQEVLKLVRSFNLEKDTILIPPVSHTMIPLILLISDVVIAPFQRDHNWLTQVPLKVVEALGMMKPIVTTPLIELKRILPPEYLVDFEELSPVILKNKLETLLYRGVNKHTLKNISVESLSWSTIAENLYKCIEGLET